MRLGRKEIDCIFVNKEHLNLPVITLELDIDRAANAVINQHGKDAPVEVAMRVDALHEAGKPDGCAVWRRILRVVEELQGTAPKSGAAVHRSDVRSVVVGAH